MKKFSNLAKSFSQKARAGRARIFREQLYIDENTKLLDLGSETGANIASVIKNTPIKSENVYIADINKEYVERGNKQYGFNPVYIKEDGSLPFEDDYFDIVYCSSVIEHVTIPKEKVWSMKSGRLFKKESLTRQKQFADEIKRLGSQYFVQTPYIYFPVESHSWLPFIAWLPRQLLIPILKFTNKIWIKKTCPDWYLLNIREMQSLFDNAKVINEKSFGLIKSIMAVKSLK